MDYVNEYELFDTEEELILEEDFDKTREYMQDNEKVRLVMLKRPDKWGLRETDEDEAQARAEYIRNYLLQDMYGSLLDLGNRETEVIIKVDKKRDGTRDIEVKLGTITKRNPYFSIQSLRNQGSQKDGDSNAYDTHDFLDNLDEFNGLNWGINKTANKLKELCVKYTSTSLNAEERHDLKRKILTVYDKWKRMRAESTRRQEVSTANWLEDNGKHKVEPKAYTTLGDTNDDSKQPNDEQRKLKGAVALTDKEKEYLKTLLKYEDVVGKISGVQK